MNSTRDEFVIQPTILLLKCAPLQTSVGRCTETTYLTHSSRFVFSPYSVFVRGERSMYHLWHSRHISDYNGLLSICIWSRTKTRFLSGCRPESQSVNICRKGLYDWSARWIGERPPNFRTGVFYINDLFSFSTRTHTRARAHTRTHAHTS